MTEKNFKMLKKIEAAVDEHWDDLTQWEKGFIEDILERFRLYGKNTHISARQWEFIEKIFDKICTG